ncbi:MAG: hypothetical protein NTV06_00560 [candidate division Zixibacteria bacterium]|nr:hypothetical protein [candidate division Zixibacteria bacterium]
MQEMWGTLRRTYFGHRGSDVVNLIPEYLDVAFALKLQLTPINVAMLIALGLAVAIVWRWAKGRIG